MEGSNKNNNNDKDEFESREMRLNPNINSQRVNQEIAAAAGKLPTKKPGEPSKASTNTSGASVQTNDNNVLTDTKDKKGFFQKLLNRN